MRKYDPTDAATDRQPEESRVTNRMVHVRRVIVVEYDVEREAYPGMTDAEIRKWERDDGNDDPGSWLESITSEEVEVTFS